MASYCPPQQSAWQGRVDSLPKERLFQVVDCIDLSNQQILSRAKHHFALLGFACDEGVRRNLGRVGAKQGPSVIRNYLANLPIHRFHNFAFTDVGDVVCDQHDLEKAQEILAEKVSQLLEAGIQPVLLGGGHEIAYGHYLGIAQANRAHNLGIINFDAHFDLRPLLPGNKGSSGTPFLQIAQNAAANQRNFDYFCLGIQEHANTQVLFQKADEFNVKYFNAATIRQHKALVWAELKNFIESRNMLYFTFCLDVLAESVAPGVSAPQSNGLFLHEIKPFFDLILSSGKIAGFDIAEYSPPLDYGQQTARIAAYLIFEMMDKICG